MDRLTLLPEIAIALGLTRFQLKAIAKLGKVNWKSRPLAIRTIKQVELTLWQASEIWGFSPTGRRLQKLATQGRMPIVNPGEYRQRVTVASMLVLMADLDGGIQRKRAKRARGG